jgi:hypothetical protein
MSVTNVWLAERLGIGAANRVSRYYGEAAGRSHIRKLTKKIETAIADNCPRFMEKGFQFSVFSVRKKADSTGRR